MEPLIQSISYHKLWKQYILVILLKWTDWKTCSQSISLFISWNAQLPLLSTIRSTSGGGLFTAQTHLFISRADIFAHILMVWMKVTIQILWQHSIFFITCTMSSLCLQRIIIYLPIHHFSIPHFDRKKTMRKTPVYVDQWCECFFESAGRNFACCVSCS